MQEVLDTKLKEFQKQVFQHRTELVNLLRSLKATGVSIAAVCASAKGNTLLNFCKLGPETIDFIAEKSKKKIGRYSPGQHIKVVSDEEMLKRNPDYLLMLACNFEGSIIPILRKKGYKGTFILPFPEIRFKEYEEQKV